jgi:hypothetical protein
MSRNLPVLHSSSMSSPREERIHSAPRRVELRVSAYAAQLLGQDGQRRGLKGGEPVLRAARTTYLHTEHMGEGDRRLPPGTLRRTAI